MNYFTLKDILQKTIYFFSSREHRVFFLLTTASCLCMARLLFFFLSHAYLLAHFMGAAALLNLNLYTKDFTTQN